MSQVPPWFGREFQFSFPVEQYPNLCVRLRGTPVRLEEMLRDAPHEALRARTEGRWSAQEHAGHLADLEPLWMARVEDFVAGGDTLTPADLTNRRTTEANHNARSVAEIAAEFRKSRCGLISRLETLGAVVFGHSMLHPRLKQPMRLVDHLYFVAEHDDHHLAMIWEMLR